MTGCTLVPNSRSMDTLHYSLRKDYPHMRLNRCPRTLSIVIPLMTLLTLPALLTTGCATPASSSLPVQAPDQAPGQTTSQAHEDAARILQLSHAEDRFNLGLRELAQRQMAYMPELKPWAGAIDNFWHEQVPWPPVQEKIVNNYSALYTAEELRAIRQSLESPLGDRIGGHSDVLNRELARQTLGAVQEKLPALDQHLRAMRNAMLTGQTGELTLEQDFAAVEAQAKSGDAASQLMLAEKLLAGAGSKQNIPLALTWLEKSAAQDHAPAQDTLSSFYYRGVGVKRDYRQAKELMEKAVTRNYLPAINNLAWLLATCPDDSLRDGKRALALLQPVMDQSAQMLDTYAAAQAEAGNFVEALNFQKRAIAAIGNMNNPQFAIFLERLLRYAAQQPWRDL